MDKIEEEHVSNELSGEEEVKEITEVSLPQTESTFPDGSLVANTSNNVELDTDEFQRRIESVKEHIAKLKESMKEEKEFFRKEIDEINQLQLKMVESNSKSLEAVSDINNSVSVFDFGNWLAKCSLMRVESKEYCLLDPTLEFPKQLKLYQGALTRAQSNRRLNLQRQISGNIYKKKLYEAEQMCKAELARIGESVKCLEPLKKTASEWNLPTDGYYQCVDHSKSSNFQEPKPNTISTDLTLSQTASSTRLNISHSGEKIAGDQISVKMNTNLNMVEVQAPLWRGDGYQQMMPIVSHPEMPLSKTSNLACIFRNNQLL